jgi:hypothetical protein
MKALIHKGIVRQVANEENPIHKDMQWVECDNTIKVGMLYDGTNFTAAPELTYAEKRENAYKPITEQLDMIYWDQVNNTTNWKDHIADVKTTYPKPE